MTEAGFLESKGRIDDFELSELHESSEWQSFFEDCIVLLGHPDPEIKDYAIDRIQKGLWAENSQQYRQEGFSPPDAQLRLLPILEAILKQGEQLEECLVRFTKWSSFSDEQKDVFSEWLKLESRGEFLSEHLISILIIQAELCCADDWNEARVFLEPLLAHENDLLRASAGSALGAMYANASSNLPDLKMMMVRMKEWEIERPGIAGPFIGQLLMDYSEPSVIASTGLNLEDWILEIIAKRRSEEPDLPMYNGIDFWAHEVLSTNPLAVRKLLDYGAESVAAMAATEINEPVDGMQGVLEVLAASADYFVSRISSWHLSYHYRLIHPAAQEKGFVQKLNRPEVEIFLVFDPEDAPERPFAATIYPSAEHLSDSLAWSWVDKLVPPELRPPVEDNSFPFQSPHIDSHYARYAYGHYYITFYGDPERKIWERVWVKWPVPSSKW